MLELPIWLLYGNEELNKLSDAIPEDLTKTLRAMSSLRRLSNGRQKTNSGLYRVKADGLSYHSICSSVCLTESPTRQCAA